MRQLSEKEILWVNGSSNTTLAENESNNSEQETLFGGLLLGGALVISYIMCPCNYYQLVYTACGIVSGWMVLYVFGSEQANPPKPEPHKH